MKKRNTFDITWLLCLAATAALFGWAIYTVLFGASVEEQIQIHRDHIARKHQQKATTP